MTKPEGEINPAAEIQARLQRLQDASDLDPEDELDFELERYTRDELEAIFEAGLDRLDRSKARKLVTYMHEKGWI